MENPLIPAEYDIAWTIFLVAFAVLVIAALISIGRVAGRLGPGITVVWALMVLALPLVGPIAWFVAGRRSAKRVAPPA